MATCKNCNKKITESGRRKFCSEYCAREFVRKKNNAVYKKKCVIPQLKLCERCKRTLGRITQEDYTVLEKHFTDGEKIYSLRMEYSSNPKVHTHYLNGRGIMGLRNVKNQFTLKALTYSKQYIELTSAFDDMIKSTGIDNLNIGKRDGDEYNRFLNVNIVDGHFYGERIHMYVAKNKVFKFHYFPDGRRKKLLEEEFKDYHWAKKEFEKMIYKERISIINELYKKESSAGVS